MDHVNLTKAAGLVLESSANGADFFAQILKGFGFADVLQASTCEGALRQASGRTIDIFVIEQRLASGEDGCKFVEALRRTRHAPNCWAPIILTMGHVRSSDVARARDCGANFVVTKPISAEALLRRILWTGRERRAFIDAETYLGPDRRFKFIGPPTGTEGRRATDRTGLLGEAREPNLSAAELDGMFKPQRAVIEI